MFALRVLLFPFSLLYDLVTRARNHLYSIGWKPSTSFDLPVISVGNLSAGGTGKTPMVEYLIRLLGDQHRLAVLSRGYGRRTRGFRLAVFSDTPDTIGDEPHQLFQKSDDRVAVAVGEDRVLAISQLLQERPDTSLIILDDAFQHRRVRPSFSILLTDYRRPFYSDLLLPGGMLREARKGASRANVVVVTKCPEHIPEQEMDGIRRRIGTYTTAPVFFATIAYAAPAPVFDFSVRCQKKVVLVTGIANAAPLKEHVIRYFDLVRHFEFSDHHHYSRRDLETIWRAGPEVSVLTTEKDKSKLALLFSDDDPRKRSFWYIPIETTLIKDGQEFDAMIRHAAANPPADKNG